MDETICPECAHLFARHEWPNGCLADWDDYWDCKPGADEGCQCKLAHVDYSTTERTRT